MERYKDLDGDSGVHSYEIGDGCIVVRFEKGGKYKYTDEKPGKEHVDEMQRLAASGNGLNAYINKHVRKNYAEKLE